jgi:hypothetical protein
MIDWKVMMIVAFTSNQIFGYQILPRNKNVDNEVYVKFLNDMVARYTLQHHIRCQIILHDNVRSHKHQNVKAFFQRHRSEELKYSSYSHDLNPCDINGIARIKRPFKGRRFTKGAGLVAANDTFSHEINYQTATDIRHLPQR